MKSSALLAFGFGNLAMLGWLAAAAAPLLIHLWSRHRFREAPWAAMQFLLAALRKNARRMQLQQWLLLALRTLIIALVVLAVAEPYGEQLVASGAGAPIHKVLVIDGSLSMAYQDKNSTRFARAKDLAADLVDNSRSGDRFTVLLMASPSRIITNRETVDQSVVRAQIESLSQPHTIADLTGTLALIEAALADDTNDSKMPERSEVYFFTDLQRASWHAAEAAAEPSAGDHSQGEPRAHSTTGEHLAELAKRVAITIVDLGNREAMNLAITNVTSPEPFATAGREITFEATLRQFGAQPRAGCTVELSVDDVPVGEQAVDVPAGGEATARFIHRFPSAGSHTLAVRAHNDQLTIDDARRLVVPVREEIRVLCVAGRDGAARYVADALNPNPAASSAIRPVVVSEGDLAEVELADFDCVFLCNVAQLTASEAQRLARYAEDGGGIVVFLGDRVIPASYNAVALDKEAAMKPHDSDLQRAGSSPTPPNDPNSSAAPPSNASAASPLSLAFLPARLGELTSETQFGLDPLDYRHPIVAPFRGRERAGLLTTPVSRYYQLDTSRSPQGVEIAAATRCGDPFIVAAPLGRGRTVLVATDGSLSSIEPTTGEPWTTWPTWPSFLPIVRELLAYALSGQNQSWQQLVGTSLSGTLAGAQANSIASTVARGGFQMVRPDGSTSPVAWQTDSSTANWSYIDTDLSGIYTLRGDPQILQQSFAVNVDTSESDLAKLDPQQLPPKIDVRATAQNGASSAATDLVTHAFWSSRLLWLAIVMMLLESFLAWQFGRGSA